MVLGATHLWWTLDRRSPVLDVDEASYLKTALGLSDAVRGGHAGEAWRFVFDQPAYNAPLLSVVTLPFHLLFGRSLVAGLAAQLVFIALALVATHVLARSFVSENWALLAAVVVAALPALLDYSRSYLSPTERGSTTGCHCRSSR